MERTARGNLITTYYQIMPDRTAETLVPIILNHVHQPTRIITAAAEKKAVPKKRAGRNRGALRLTKPAA